MSKPDGLVLLLAGLLGCGTVFWSCTNEPSVDGDQGSDQVSDLQVWSGTEVRVAAGEFADNALPALRTMVRAYDAQGLGLDGVYITWSWARYNVDPTDWSVAWGVDPQTSALVNSWFTRRDQEDAQSHVSYYGMGTMPAGSAILFTIPAWYVLKASVKDSSACAEGGHCYALAWIHAIDDDETSGLAEGSHETDTLTGMEIRGDGLSDPAWGVGKDLCIELDYWNGIPENEIDNCTTLVSQILSTINIRARWVEVSGVSLSSPMPVSEMRDSLAATRNPALRDSAVHVLVIQDTEDPHFTSYNVHGATLDWYGFPRTVYSQQSRHPTVVDCWRKLPRQVDSSKVEISAVCV